MSDVFTMRWQRGSLVLAVSCPHGRTWAYPVVPIGDRPLPHFLLEVPWMLPPGSEWGSDDDDRGRWTAAVVPVSEAAAEELFAPDTAVLPPGELTVAEYPAIPVLGR